MADPQVPAHERVLIVNRRGPARPGGGKVREAGGQFDAAITGRRNGTDAGGSSIMGLMMLAASPGTEVEIEAKGRRQPPPWLRWSTSSRGVRRELADL